MKYYDRQLIELCGLWDLLCEGFDFHVSGAVSAGDEEEIREAIARYTEEFFPEGMPRLAADLPLEEIRFYLDGCAREQEQRWEQKTAQDTGVLRRFLPALTIEDFWPEYGRQEGKAVAFPVLRTPAFELVLLLEQATVEGEPDAPFDWFEFSETESGFLLELAGESPCTVAFPTARSEVRHRNVLHQNAEVLADPWLYLDVALRCLSEKERLLPGSLSEEEAALLAEPLPMPKKGARSLKNEPVWRDLYHRIAATQSEYLQEQPFRAEVESAMQAAGFEGEYPNFFKKGEKPCAVLCWESYGNEVTLLAGPGEDPLAALYRGEAFALTPAADTVYDSVLALAKRVSGQPLTKEERALLPHRSGWSYLFQAVFMGLFFGGGMWLFFTLAELIVLLVTRSLDQFGIVPWWLPFLVGGGLFGGLVTLVDWIKERK